MSTAGNPIKRAGGWPDPVKVMDDRIVMHGKIQMLTPDVEAVVDTAGNLSHTQRYTLTRFALLGPLSVFTPKGQKYDDRELFLLLKGPDWAEVVRCNKNRQGATRVLAQAIELAAHHVNESLENRRRRVEEARRHLEQVKSDNSAIEEAESAYARSYRDITALVQAGEDLQRGIESASADPKTVERARKTLTEINSLIEASTHVPAESPSVALNASPHVSEDAKREHIGESGDGKSALDDDEAATDELADQEAADGNLESATCQVLPHEVSERQIADQTSEPVDTEPTNEDFDKDTTDPFEGIRKLAELRDANLITNEEYEQKKAELLKRI